MTLCELFKSFSSIRWPAAAGFGDREVSSLAFDSRKVLTGGVFVAIRGAQADGHGFLAQAVQNGAAVLVLEDSTLVPPAFDGAILTVANTRDALNLLSAKYFAEPAKKLYCMGVTGTNGKTTITYMVEQIFNAAGVSCGVVGTINHHLRDKVWPTDRTTPDALQFQSRLKDFVDLGAQAVVLEVTSHALSQARVDEVPFSVALFTNLTRDHLDYHGDMEHYFAAKERLFTELLTGSEAEEVSAPAPVLGIPTAVVNYDDSYGRKIRVAAGARLWSYGVCSDADLRITVLKSDFAGTRFNLDTPFGSQEFSIQMPGLHNVSNAVAAVGAGLARGFSLKTCADALEKLNGVKGRLESVENNKGLHVFVDYAHTDDALKTVLHYLGEIRKNAGLQNRIITVFGCGGDRDKGKRPLMMKAASQGSDLVIVTSDNPRTENPESIIDDAIAGAAPSDLQTRVFRETDRRKGIAKAIDMAKPGDVILVAGKGHEDYQEIGKSKFPFSDVTVVQELLQ
jgi:UDP-N-acetylmuramoyl-L-alanyl-D-glutamate--2,6-diaminopimelate ligase